MDTKFSTVQEEFWAGKFGDNYIERNKSREYLASNLNFFSKVLTNIDAPQSIIEFGANVGMNLLALQFLCPNSTFKGVEINHKASEELRKNIGDNNVFEQSIFEYSNDKLFDLSFIKGVLIHINPEKLPIVYENLYASSKKFILIAEYYNPSPVTIPYRGESDKLFKRDFAGEMLDKYPDLKLINYGFVYHRDNSFKQDDVTWFLLEK